MSKITEYEKYELFKDGVNADALQKVIEDHIGTKEKMQLSYERYKATEKGVPIFSRTFDNEDKVNNKINNDFFSEIIDTKVGYMCGNPIVYQTSNENENAQTLLTDFTKVNDFEDMDADTIQMMAICGVAHRLAYFDTDGILRIKLINSWEVIYIYDDTGKVIYAIRYYEIKDKTYKIDIYDEINRQHWINADGDYKPYGDEEGVKLDAHMFKYVPMIKFSNNKEEQGDCDKVVALIDGYDRTFSDESSEVEQFRLAYLALLGCEIDEPEIEKMKKTGVFSLPEGCDAKFILKQLDGEILENILNRSEKNILRFAKSANFTDSEFATSSGIALRYKLLPLETKSKKTELKFSKGTREMFKVVASAWSVKTDFNYLDISWIYKRNVPTDLKDEAEATNKLKGYISEKTRLSLLSFIDNVEEEVEEMEKDAEADIDLNNIDESKVNNKVNVTDTE